MKKGKANGFPLFPFAAEWVDKHRGWFPSDSSISAHAFWSAWIAPSPPAETNIIETALGDISFRRLALSTFRGYARYCSI